MVTIGQATLETGGEKETSTKQNGWTAIEWSGGNNYGAVCAWAIKPSEVNLLISKQLQIMLAKDKLQSFHSEVVYTNKHYIYRGSNCEPVSGM